MGLDFETLAGTHCPIVTPFSNGSVDHASIRSVIDFVLDGGVDGIVPCGTTGEFASMTAAERDSVVETTVEHVDRRGPVIAGTAGNAIADVLERIDAAAAAGADGVLLPSASFHPANEDAGDREFFERIADDSALPIVLYNIPICVGRPIPLDVVVSLATHSSILGIKDSSGDSNYLFEIIRRTDGAEFAVLQGFDSLLAPALLVGAAGGINALSGVYPAAFDELYRAVQESNPEEALEIQRETISPMFQQCLEKGFAPVVKAQLSADGIIDTEMVRPPLVATTATGSEN